MGICYSKKSDNNHQLNTNHKLSVSVNGDYLKISDLTINEGI